LIHVKEIWAGTPAAYDRLKEYKMQSGQEARERADIVVFGGGSFATALAYVLSKNKHNITLLTRSEDVCRSINEQHRNPKYLSDFTLPHNIKASTHPEQVVAQARYIVHAVPVQVSLSYLKKMAPFISPSACLISSSKACALVFFLSGGFICCY